MMFDDPITWLGLCGGALLAYVFCLAVEKITNRRFP